MFVVSQMIEERHNISRAKVAGMPPRSRCVPVKFQIPAHPLTVSLLRPQTVVFDPHHLPQLIQQLGLRVGNDERSLCRERFRGHNFTICNNHRQKRNKNLIVAGQQYPAFWLPNIC